MVTCLSVISTLNRSYSLRFFYFQIEILDITKLLQWSCYQEDQFESHMDMEHNFFFFSFFLLVFLLYMDFNFYWMFGQMGLPDHSTTLKLVISSGLHQTMTSCQNTQALEHQPSKQAYHVCFKSHGNCCGLAICIHMTKGLLCALSQQPKSRFLIEVMR